MPTANFTPTSNLFLYSMSSRNSNGYEFDVQSRNALNRPTI